MKAEVDIFGTLIITQESQTELYALNQWKDNSMFHTDNVIRDEKSYFIGSSFSINDKDVNYE